ncbi:Hsp70 family protein [Actinophytocola sp. NPDC049390]|uniref:Hsp70 family protein n=1 Tax=Actinophytocola sp. NPDC049390 TaxID=3363894 RepID=UPI0037A26E14
MSVLSVDLGTSNTVAVLSALDRQPRVVEVEGASSMPSAVFAAEDGALIVGREAERRARLSPARYEPNPKRRVDDGSLLLGDSVVPVTNALAAVLGKVAAEVGRQLGGARPDEVRLTHPAQWGAARQNILLSAARQAGLGNPRLVPEPVAAAAHFAAVTGVGTKKPLAVYDLGAGTFDVAVVGGATVLAEGGLADLGGLDVDQALLDHIGRQVSARDPGGWQRLLRPESTADRRAARALREDVRAAKESLSDHPQTEVPLPDPFGDVLVTRAELESLIRPGLLRSVEVLASTVEAAGTSLGELAGIYLVGGSSRIPLVATLIAERLRVLPVNLDQPETAVALGAHHVNEDGTSLRTRDVPPQLAETRTTAIHPPARPAPSSVPAAPTAPPGVPAAAPATRAGQPGTPMGPVQPGMPTAAPAPIGTANPVGPARAPATYAGQQGFAGHAPGHLGPPVGPPAPGLLAPGHPRYGTGQPWAGQPTPPKTAAEQLGIVGCVAMFVLGVGSLAAANFFMPAIAVLSVPLFYAGLRLARKHPRPLPFFCYGYAILIAIMAILGVVAVIARPAVTDASDLVLPGILGGVAIVLALVPLIVRAVREGARPPAVR